MSVTERLKGDEYTVVQIESRNYVCGKMAIGHPLTDNFLRELRRRNERHFHGSTSITQRKAKKI